MSEGAESVLKQENGTKFARWPRPAFYAVLVLALALDQVTKTWAHAALEPIRRVTLVPGFFDLTYNENTGIAFGMFAGQGLLVGLCVIVLAIVALYYTKGLNWARWESSMVGGCLCGGALGNLIDRARLGYVIDFFDFHVGHYYWPIFNVADSLICLSVGWIVLRQFTGKD